MIITIKIEVYQYFGENKHQMMNENDQKTIYKETKTRKQ